MNGGIPLFNPWEPASMRRMFFLSIAFHLSLVGLLYAVSSIRNVHPMSIYQVGLVSMPTPAVKEVVPAPVRKIDSPPVVKAKPVPVKPKAPPPKPKPAVVKPVAPPPAAAVPDLKKSKVSKAEASPPQPAEPEAVQSEAASDSPTNEASVAEPSVPSIVANVDLPNFEFPYYLRLVQGKIGSRWSPPDVGTGEIVREVVVSFTLIPSGKVQEVVVEKSSGNDYFDQAAMRAIYLADPLPPLPKGFTEPNLKIHFSFLLGKSG